MSVLLLLSLPAQLALAVLALARTLRSLRGQPVPPMRSLRQTGRMVMALLRGRAPREGWAETGQGDLVNLFLLAAACLTLLYAAAPPETYPYAAFAVPTLALALRAGCEGFPHRGGSIEGALVAATLIGGAVVLAWRGGEMGWAALACWFALFPALAWRHGTA